MQAEISPAQGGGASGKQEAPGRAPPPQASPWARCARGTGRSQVSVGAALRGSRSGSGAGPGGSEHDGLTTERALAVGALPPEEGPAGQPAAPGAAGGGAQVSGAAGTGMGSVSPAGLSPESATGNGRTAGSGDVRPFGFLGRVSEEFVSAL